MMSAPDLPGTFRFQDFELDLGAYELRRQGRRVRIERRPMELLILLVERRGQLVSRAEIVERLWGRDVFVEVETGINTVVRKVRQALGDSPDAPKFVETVPGKGYRFIASVDALAPPAAPAASGPAVGPEQIAEDPVAQTASADAPAARKPDRTRPIARLLPAGLMAIALIGSFALWTWRRSDPGPARVTLAVLPFKNIGSDPEREYLADGLAEETTAALAQVEPEHFVVTARTSTLNYRNTTKTVAQIGAELSVDYLVEGSIQEEGGRVRVRSSLTRVADQAQIWSNAYDSEPRSMLELQQALSSTIAAQIRLTLSPERLNALARRQTQDPVAYDLYLRGRRYWRHFQPETTKLAVEHFARATARDPDYALAWAGLADAYATSPINGDRRPQDVRDLAREAAQRAFAAEPDLAEAHSSLGFVNFFLDWKWTEAEKNFRMAVARDSGSELSHRMLGILLSHMRKPDDAAREMLRARELDPVFPMVHALSAQVAFAARDYPAAVRFARDAIIIGPGFWIGHLQLGQALEQTGDLPGALSALEQANHLNGNSKALSVRGYILARLHRERESREILDRMKAIGRERYWPPYAIALVHAGLGEHDEALEWLGRALEERDVHLIFLPIDAKWDRMRSDSRFDALLKACGFD